MRNLVTPARLGTRMRRPWRLGPIPGPILIALVSACTAGDPTPRTAAPPSAPTASPASPGPASTPPGPASTPPGPDDVDCDDSIGTLKIPTPGTRVVLGVVALPTEVLATVPVAGRLWSKRGLEVLAGAVVEISVAREAADQAALIWGSAREPGSRQRVNGCSVVGCAADCGWLAFAGGYWVDAPACVPIVVRSNGREARVGVAVGAACG
jgi:hypothetical protein